jgi:hypothetical protein
VDREAQNMSVRAISGPPTDEGIAAPQISPALLTGLLIGSQKENSELKPEDSLN